jgi:hypothetical protein
MMHTGECFGGPYDGETRAEEGMSFQVDFANADAPRVRTFGRDYVIVRTRGWYSWKDDGWRWMGYATDG